MTAKPLDLRLVHQAVVLARHGNFGRAAAALHVSQPTLSRNIGALERKLGVKLFDRSAAGIEPTSFGKLVLDRGGRLLTGQSDLVREIQLHAGIEIGNLAVSAGPYAIEISVGTAMARLIAAHPRLRVRVEVADPRVVLRDVQDGRVDIGVTDVRTMNRTAVVNAEPLPRHDILFACRPGHPLAARARLSRSDLLSYPIASPLVPRDASSAIEAAGPASGAFDETSGDFLPSITVNTSAVARQIAAGSDALVPGSASMLAPDIEAGRLVLLNFRSPHMRTHYAITTLRERTPSPAALVFMELVRQVENEIVATETSLLRVQKGRRRRRA